MFLCKSANLTRIIFLFSEYLRAPAFTAPNAEINFRTLWVFLNSAFEDDFVHYKGSHLFREVFQVAYVKAVELITQTLTNTPDEFIRVEVSRIYSDFSRKN